MAIVVTDEAAKKALQVYVMHAGKPHEGMAAAILSALPGLAVAAPAVDGQYWTERFDVLTNAIDSLADKVERSTAPDYNRAFQRGVTIGRAEGEATAIDGQVLDTGPSDYEVWRDALLIAAQTVEVKGDTDEVVYVARKLVGTLRRSGARIDDDTADDFAPDDVLGFTEPVEDADDEEVDCVRCGAPPGGHPDGCPTMAVPTPLTFPGVNPDGTGTGEWSGRAGG